MTLTFFKYPGGQRLLVKYLLPLIPKHEIYVEVFGGSATLLFGKKPSKIEVYNDIDSHLVNLFEVVRRNPQAFKLGLKWLLYSRALREKFKNMKTKDPIEEAIETYYLHYSGYGGRRNDVWNWTRCDNRARIFQNAIKRLDQIHKRLQNVYIECLDFRVLIQKWNLKETFFFLDPPYYGIKQYKHSFEERDHENLAKLLRDIKGKFLLTYNYHSRIQEFYKNFIQKPVQTRSSLMQKERLLFSHLIIRNYEGT